MTPTLRTSPVRLALRTVWLWNRFGGATVDPNTGRDLTGSPSFAVTVPWAASVLTVRTWDAVAHYLAVRGPDAYTSSFDTTFLTKYPAAGAERAAAFRDYPRAFGTWTDPDRGRHMVSFSLLVPTQDEAEYWGRRFRQLCVYDLTACRTIATAEGPFAADR